MGFSSFSSGELVAGLREQATSPPDGGLISTFHLHGGTPPSLTSVFGRKDRLGMASQVFKMRVDPGRDSGPSLAGGFVPRGAGR